jgi:predicted nucleic acid-binding Zn ribbon protein
VPRGETHAVGDVIGGILRQWERRAGGPIERIIACWAEVVGEPIAASARPVETEGKTLVVETRDTVWRDQLARFYGKLIVAKLNRRLGGKVVTDIRFRVVRDAEEWERA